MNKTTWPVICVAWIVGATLMLSAFADPAAAQHVNHPDGPADQLLSVRNVGGSDAKPRLLRLMRAHSELVLQKDLSPGITYQPPKSENLIYQIVDGSLSESQQAKLPKANELGLLSFVECIGSRMFVLFEQPDEEDLKAQAVPIYGLAFNGGGSPTSRSQYSAAITAGDDSNSLLVCLVGVEGLKLGHIAAFRADLSSPLAYGIYDGHRVRIMGNQWPSASPIISEFIFKVPLLEEIQSVDSLLISDEVLLVSVRFKDTSSTSQEGDVSKRYFQLNLESKEWKESEHGLPAQPE